MNRNRGMALVMVLLIALVMSVMATAFVNFQVNDKRMSTESLFNEKAYYMADSGIQVALAKISRDSTWQGQSVGLSPPYQVWVNQEGPYKYGYKLESQFNFQGLADPDSYNYHVRSIGVVVDTSYAPPRIVASRIVSAFIQCQSDYNADHEGGAITHYTEVGNGTEAILWRYYDEFK